MGSSSSDRRIIRFGTFELDAQSGELRKNGLKVKLSDQPFQVLTALVDHPGEVVTREQLCRGLWSDGTFVDFEHGLNAAIKKLRQALGDTAENPRFIETLPKHGYRFIVPVDSGKSAGDVAAAPLKQQRKLWAWVAGLAAAVAIAGVIWFTRDSTPASESALAVTPLTTFHGTEEYPTFSPDGNQVAFSWDGETRSNIDIYVILIGNPTAWRLTTDPAPDEGPAWSPDGRWIAFVRGGPDRKDKVILVPAIGGPERVLAEFSMLRDFGAGPYLDWTPDSKHLLVGARGSDEEPAGLFRLDVETGEQRRITTTPPGAFGDTNPALSADGRTLVFTRYAGIFSAHLLVLPLAEDFTPNGEPQTLTGTLRYIAGSAWTPDESTVIFSSGPLTGASLFRIPLSGGEPQPVQPDPSSGQIHPAISATGHRLVFSQSTYDRNIWRVSLPEGQPERFISSTRLDGNPQYSPDGKWVAFESARSGHDSLWVASADGTGARILVSGPDTHAGTPRWSPDSARIAFDWRRGETWAIYVTNLHGGSPVPLTTDLSDDVIPSWSHDGNWIYFASRRSGQFEVWKTPASGGEAIQITRSGGHVAFESVDGRTLYYTKTNSQTTSLWKAPVGGGEEAEVLPSICWRNFFVVADGIYFCPAPDPDSGYTVQYLDFASGKVRRVATLTGVASLGLTVSPDGRFLAFSQADNIGADLIRVENFR